MRRFEAPANGLRAEVYRDGSWHTIPNTWLVHWTIEQPDPILYAIAGELESRVAAPWRVYRNSALVASTGLRAVAERGTA